jgi:hypothetical protein
MADTTSDTIYQLKVTLKDIQPPIWRRVLVRNGITLGELHRILQAAMGWESRHLYEFQVDGESFADPDVEDEPPEASVHDVALASLAPTVGSKLVYRYDLGDGWEHEIEIEKTMRPASGATYPCCVGGERACPPEDCGGVEGYADVLEALADPKHPEHDSYIRWLGEPFDPEAFDLEAANGSLARLR